MILSDIKIRKLLEKGELKVDPLDESQIQPASIDLRLGKHFLKLKDNNITHLDFETPPEYISLEMDQLILHPHSFILATTVEYLVFPDNLTAFVEGRSSIGRMGLFIQNAGWVDPGFEGEITLELYNANNVPICLKSGRRICQLVLAQMDQSAGNPYNGKYQKQRSATGSRVYLDSENKS
ncbi:MAG: dCTP deaminase [Deltaproteobacteria bacterium]|nr:dCTP deaminase [Deltaproteobacteria bacterium]